ncbi:GntR family transcriptional regulator [Comamonas aquatica]|uniref:GntR family transcriptional regulator n=1 Tax=Comamonas jiangduensis TaxID=1194168 RepID=UPI0015813EAD|nr:GntR family transcriptional regulator [Comamonas jiangduensis]QXW18074.1 GntR family transcriptional regulator [Comamonas aquatica]
MTIQTLQAHSLCIAIADKLRERILSHQMLPGSDINDGALALEFGVSRTPVREAMKLLCHEGLLTAQPRRGMTVTCLTAAQEAEAQQLCQVLAQHLNEIGHKSSTSCTELTQRVYAIAQARLQLAMGPRPSYTPAISEQHSAAFAD